MFASVLIVMRVLVKTGISLLPCASNSCIDLLPKTFPLGQTSVSPSLCPVQSQPPRGSVCSPTEPQHPWTLSSANNASPQTTSLRLPAAETPNCPVLKTAHADRETAPCALLIKSSLGLLFFFYFLFFSHLNVLLPPRFIFRDQSTVKSERRKVAVTPQVFKE